MGYAFFDDIFRRGGVQTKTFKGRHVGRRLRYALVTANFVEGMQYREVDSLLARSPTPQAQVELQLGQSRLLSLRRLTDRITSASLLQPLLQLSVCCPCADECVLQ